MAMSKKEIDKRYYEKNKDKILEKSRKWQEENKDRVRKKQQEYYQKNKERIKIRSNKRYHENKDEILEKAKKFREENPEKIASQQRKWEQSNKEQINKYKRTKALTDINYRLALNLRKRLNKAIRNGQKSGSAVKDLGCTIEELKIYLESQFEKGMSWDNYGIGGWEIDHIKPCNTFDLTNRDEFLICCNYTNLRPMWASKNRSRPKKG